MSDQVLYVDFNDTDEDRNVIALRSRENRRVQVALDEAVELRDHDGFSVDGLVVGVSRDAFVVAPVWATWRNPSSVRITHRSEPSEDDLVMTLMDALPTVGTERLISKT